ncbi:MAG: hypothetical protein K2H74_02080 [Paramuribaculum sp.]|nr:hypothetical protein [Paramuribaculum sp.]
MKKFLILFLTIVGFTISANAQNVVIQQNGSTSSSEQTTDPNIFYINGIPSTADIGGVEAVAWYPKSNYDYVSLKLKNYRAETVTVLYYIETSKGAERNGSIVLAPQETKWVNLETSKYSSGTITTIATITRKL